MTVVFICLVVATAFAVLGVALMQAGRREERAETSADRRRRLAAQRKAREAELARGARPPETAPVPRRTRPRRPPEPAAVPAATAAAELVPAPATAGAADIQAAGRARLEAALARARARLAEEQSAPGS
jgi:hypothetical protein